MALAAGPAQAHHPRGLRDLAERPLIGTAVNTDLLGSDATYTAILDREFNSVTPENAMKWESVEAQRGVLDFSAADRLVAHARAHHQIVRGHTLVWHSQLPAWLTSGTFTNDELEAILHKHITDEVSHFRGRIYAWDVVNEAFNEDCTLRDTIWLRQLGPSYIAKAFRWAHQADRHRTGAHPTVGGGDVLLSPVAVVAPHRDDSLVRQEHPALLRGTRLSRYPHYACRFVSGEP
jgi:endo-1,4-beta-xylanase